MAAQQQPERASPGQRWSTIRRPTQAPRQIPTQVRDKNPMPEPVVSSDSDVEIIGERVAPPQRDGSNPRPYSGREAIIQATVQHQLKSKAEMDEQQQQEEQRQQHEERRRVMWQEAEKALRPHQQEQAEVKRLLKRAEEEERQ
nr:alpha/beta-gliadin-like [Drosophila takahashii]